MKKNHINKLRQRWQEPCYLVWEYYCHVMPLLKGIMMIKKGGVVTQTELDTAIGAIELLEGPEN